MKQIFDVVYFSEDYKKKIELAKKLGFSGIIFINIFKDKGEIPNYLEKISLISKEENFFCYPAIEFSNVKEMIKFSREKNFLIFFRGTSKNSFRSATKDFGLDVVLVSENLDRVSIVNCKNNEIYIGISFNDFLNFRNRFKTLEEIIKLSRKYEANLLIFSGARSFLEMKNWYALANFLTLFGLEIKDAKNCLSNYDKLFFRRSEKFIAPGIELV